MAKVHVVDGTNYLNSNPSPSLRSYERRLPALPYLVDILEKDARQRIDPDATVGLDITTHQAERNTNYTLEVSAIVLVGREKLYGKDSIQLRADGMPSLTGAFPKELPLEMSHLVGPDHVYEVFRFRWPNNPFLHTYSKGPWVANVPWVRWGTWDASSFSQSTCQVDLKSETFNFEGRAPIPIPDRLITGYQVMEELTKKVSDLMFEAYGLIGAGRILNMPSSEYDWRMTYTPNRPLIDQFPEDFTYWFDAVGLLVEKLWNQIRQRTRNYYSRVGYHPDPYYNETASPDVIINILDDGEEEN